MGIKFVEEREERLRREWNSETDIRLRAIILETEDWLHHKHRVRDVFVMGLRRTKEEHREFKGMETPAVCPHFWTPTHAADIKADFTPELEKEIVRHMLEAGASCQTFFRQDTRGRYLHVEVSVRNPLKADPPLRAEDRSVNIVQ